MSNGLLKEHYLPIATADKMAVAEEDVDEYAYVYVKLMHGKSVHDEPVAVRLEVSIA